MGTKFNERGRVFKMKWEPIAREQCEFYTDRLKVPGGWIVRTSDIEVYPYSAISESSCFVRDPNHEWKLDA